MKATFFNKPLEWNIDAIGEAWPQGSDVKGKLTVKNHGADPVDLTEAGVALAHADIKKIHARTEGALKFDVGQKFEEKVVGAGETKELAFTLALPVNCAVTDKKSSYFLAYGRNLSENHLQLKVEPRALFAKIVGLFDTFHRFKLKEFKAAKTGVEYKLIPPTSRDMANLESLTLSFLMDGENLTMVYDFAVRKLDTAGVTTKVNKDTVKLTKTLLPKQYSLGRDLINQDALLRSIEETLGEVKLKSVF